MDFNQLAFDYVKSRHVGLHQFDIEFCSRILASLAMTVPDKETYLELSTRIRFRVSQSDVLDFFLIMFPQREADASVHLAYDWVAVFYWFFWLDVVVPAAK